jgi:DNA-binding IclR family transcriptional regulator
MPHANQAPGSAPDDGAAAAVAVTKAPTKFASVLALLQREQGATLAELAQATDWQPHTTRAMLTGLRRKGHAIERRKRDDVTCYHLRATAA